VIFGGGSWAPPRSRTGLALHPEIFTLVGPVFAHMTPLAERAATLTRRAAEAHAESMDALRSATGCIHLGDILAADRQMAGYRSLVCEHHELVEEIARVQGHIADARRAHALGGRTR
jgi:hypothetical protein